MSVMYNKGKNYTILKETFSVPAKVLQELLANNIILHVGDFVIVLENKQGVKTSCNLDTMLNTLVKNHSPKHIMQVNEFVATYVNTLAANKASGVVIPVLSEPAIPKPIKSSPFKKAPVAQDFNTAPVVKLRDASLLYQRVHGTSTGSVYRVVAIANTFKVAARVQGASVSIRVEGIFTSALVNTFNTLGIQKKTEEYLSGHFTCEKCTPQKLIGGILVSVGVQFETPLPVISTEVFS